MLAIFDRSNAVGYRKNEADVRAVCELAEGHRDAVFEYQVRVNPKGLDQLVESFADALVVITTKGHI